MRLAAPSYPFWLSGEQSREFAVSIGKMVDLT